MRDPRIWITVVGLALGGWLISSQLSGGPRSLPVTQDELADAVFLCRESGELFAGKVRPTPALHPITGKETLLPALYCPKCQQWEAAPALEQQQRAAMVLKCAKTKAALERTGPVPETATRI
ncbi:hypothetical protein GC163_00640 [bacterium]|nr:hypothetical protein [bacterium]